MTLNAPPYCRTLACVMLVLFTFSVQTKFEISSFVCSKCMALAPKCRNGSRDPDHAHLGIVRHHKADTSCSQQSPTCVHNLKSLVVVVPEIFQEV